MKDRTAVRIVPPRPVTVIIETPELIPVAYGAVANISDAGACLWTAAGFHAGDRIILQMNFAGEEHPLQAAARVIWSDWGDGGGRCGLQWAARSGPQHARLKSLIGEPVHSNA